MPYVGAQAIPKASLTLTEGSLVSSSQTISVPGGYTVGNIEVTINGAELQTGEYTATDGLVIDLGEVFPAGTEYKVKEYRSFQVADHYTKSESDSRYAQLSGANNFDTMPTVGGDPVVESGSNTDGEWTRWADGTQIVYNMQSAGSGNATTGSIYTSSLNVMNFPVAFSASPNVNEKAIRTSGTGVAWGGDAEGAGATTTTSHEPRITFSTSDSRGYIIVSAVGRWK